MEIMLYGSRVDEWTREELLVIAEMYLYEKAKGLPYFDNPIKREELRREIREIARRHTDAHHHRQKEARLSAARADQKSLPAPGQHGALGDGADS